MKMAALLFPLVRIPLRRMLPMSAACSQEMPASRRNAAYPTSQSPAYSVLNARLRKAALLVDDVQEVTSIDLETFDTETRKVTGDIKFISKEGENGAIEF